MLLPMGELRPQEVQEISLTQEVLGQEEMDVEDEVDTMDEEVQYVEREQEEEAHLCPDIRER